MKHKEGTFAMDEIRAFELLREIAFTRMSGTPEELKAAEIFAR